MPRAVQCHQQPAHDNGGDQVVQIDRLRIKHGDNTDRDQIIDNDGSSQKHAQLDGDACA